jgi:hypothetical protein
MKRHIVILAIALAPTIASAEPLNASSRPGLRETATELTVESILDRINTTYVGGLRRCYNKALANDPTLNRKIVATFTVSRNGQVLGAIHGIAPQVDECLTNQLRRWRFPGPRDLEEATFKITLALQS